MERVWNGREREQHRADFCCPAQNTLCTSWPSSIFWWCGLMLQPTACCPLCRRTPVCPTGTWPITSLLLCRQWPTHWLPPLQCSSKTGTYYRCIDCDFFLLKDMFTICLVCLKTSQVPIWTLKQVLHVVLLFILAHSLKRSFANAPEKVMKKRIPSLSDINMRLQPSN